MNPNALQFASYALPTTLTNVLKKHGFVTPTPVQQKVIPAALRGDSLLARFATGSGKTHAFLIPLFAKLNPTLGLQAIIMSPTRELALQIQRFAQQIITDFDPSIRVVMLTGGRELEASTLQSWKDAHILILTPGRFEALLQATSHNPLKDVKTVILDEADMLMDDSFSPLIFSFLQRFESTQLLIFSASFNQHLIPKFKAYIHADHVFEDDTPTINSNAIVHKLIDIRHQSPVDAIMKCIQLLNPFRLIIFASTVQKVKMISESLIEHQLPIATMHGELAFRERKSLLKRIQNGQYQIIVASDMAARGMDFPDVSDVISVDLPKDITYYYHRAGRTGRLNKTGTSYVFHQKDDAHLLKRLEQQGVKFLPFVLKDNALTPARAKRTFKPQEDTQFKRDLKKAMHQSRSSKVKPGYKRKVKRAVEKVKKQYKRKAINAKIRKRLFKGES